MLKSHGPAWHPLLICALTAACWLWAPTARAQGATKRVAPCPQRWLYTPPRTTGYIGPPFVSDSAGDFFWWEQAGTPELVAVRDGNTRWRRRLSASTGEGPGHLIASLLNDDLLVVAFPATVEGRRTSDGRMVWSRNLRADLSPELRRAGLAKNTELQTSAAARVGRALVTATAASATDAWLTATVSDGKRLWRTHIAGPVARMAAVGDRLYLMYASTNGPPIITVDSHGKEIRDARVPFDIRMAVTGGEVVVNDGRVVTAIIAPMPQNCPPNSPSCRQPPFLLTVTGFTAGQERWHLTSPLGSMRVQMLLLSDSSVLLVDGKRVGRISPDGELSPLCELPVEKYRSIAGLVHGDVVVAYYDSVGAYTLPGAPQLAATGWVMSGGGPAQDWARRAAP